MENIINLSEKSNIELELLSAREEQILKTYTRIYHKIDALCKEETDLTLERFLESYEYCLDKLKALKEEIKEREA
jgi:hypothetical protein